MIIKFRNEVTEMEFKEVQDDLMSQGMKLVDASSSDQKLFGVIGDTSKVDVKAIEAYDGISTAIRIQEEYKLASRSFHPSNSQVKVCDKVIGDGSFTIIGGPCAVESRDHIIEMAKIVKDGGGHMLRGGAFKPRTSPYSFQGLGREGVMHMVEAKQITGLPVVTEIMSDADVQFFADNVDLIQVGARNMQNFKLLRALSELNKPILLKRGMSATIKEWILAAEYIMSGGNENVIFCERGIRTFETATRNTLDISAVPVIKRATHLPIIIDPSHSGGEWWMVEDLSRAALAIGADGIIVETHSDPVHASSDGGQSLKPKKFAELVTNMDKLSRAMKMEF